jgi:hypothetical protein
MSYSLSGESALADLYDASKRLQSVLLGSYFGNVLIPGLRILPTLFEAPQTPRFTKIVVLKAAFLEFERITSVKLF